MTNSTDNALTPLNEDFSRALVIVAHPDDVEFGAASAIARWTRQGKTIRYCMVTSGEAGIDSLPPDECRPLREAEQRESARIVGVEDVDFLGFPDGTVTYSLELRAALARQIRIHRPEIIITGNFRESFGGQMPNQADHIAVGHATIDAVRDAGNRWIYPDQLTDGIEPWSGVRAVWAAGSPNAAHGVDTTDTFRAGVASLEAHRAYIDGLGWDDFNPEEMLASGSRPIGSRLGVTYGAAFEVFTMQFGA